MRLLEQKPHKRTPAQTGHGLAELVCSNSLRGAALSNAVGLLKEELRRMGSLVLACADATAVPAGGALAVDRERFSAAITHAIDTHPLIERVACEVLSIPVERPVVLATGPLTGDALAADLERVVGAEHLAYYDAIAPIVAADSIDWTRVWKQSRWGKGEVVEAGAAAEAAHGAVVEPGEGEPVDAPEGAEPGEAAESDGAAQASAGDAAYVNCPFTEDEYRAFVRALVEAEKVPARDFEEPRYFEGCLPCEVMAERGEQTLAFGPMKPVGLTDPRTGRRPYAVVQLRAEDAAATAYNLVGFQTRMRYPEQARVFRLIPGLEQAEFVRFGSVHRNTFLHAPTQLDGSLELRAAPGVYVAGQLAGVEGYVESAACGLIAGLFVWQRLVSPERDLVRPPPTTALGGLLGHLARDPGGKRGYQPSNVTWALVPPLGYRVPRKLGKQAKFERLAERALADLASFAAAVGARPAPVAEAGAAAAPTEAPRRAACEAEGALA